MISESDINNMAQLLVRSRKQNVPDKTTEDRLLAMGYSKYDVRKVFEKSDVMIKKEMLMQKIVEKEERKNIESRIEPAREIPENAPQEIARSEIEKPKSVSRFLGLIGGKTKSETLMQEASEKKIQENEKEIPQTEQLTKPKIFSLNQIKPEEVPSLEDIARKQVIEAKPIIEVQKESDSIYQEDEEEVEEEYKEKKSELQEEKPVEISEPVKNKEAFVSPIGPISKLQQVYQRSQEIDKKMDQSAVQTIVKAKLEGHDDRECIEMLLKAGFDAEATERIMSKVLFEKTA
ncbi:MAG: hypothetical protein Q7K42_05995 [Candidatus Diapherotrites archaeon]|nr:hypothetical protein [Candidatus Diapherotrites archaeon]